MKPNLRTPPKLLRSAVARGLSTDSQMPSVERDGGDQGAGIIRGMAVLTRGEALGHGLWCDSVMLEQCAAFINATGSKGVKTRFTHPDISGDGLGKYTGRAKSAWVDGDVVRADLHFGQAAHETPDGDLAGYLLTLAAEDPESFGNSIAFEQDTVAELEFLAEHGAELDAEGYLTSLDGWESPDPANADNLPHARIARLQAVDAVDDPAANPSGLFHQTHVAHDAEKLVAYSLGLSNEVPKNLSFDAHPDRIRGFIARFLDTHNLTLSAKGKPMPLTTAELDQQLKSHFSGVKAKKKFSDDKEDKGEMIDRAAQEQGDADKHQGHEEGKDERRGDNYSAKTGTTFKKMESDDGDGNDEQLGEGGQDDDPDSKEDKDEAMSADVPDGDRKEGKGFSRKLATGGEAPGGDSAGDEVARQKQYQDDEEEKRKKSQEPAKKGTPIASPGTEPGAIGPLGDASNNVGYAAARAECARFAKAFGAQGAVWFGEGLTFEQAQQKHSEQLSKVNAELLAENEKLKAKLSAKRGLSEPLSGGESSPATKGNGISSFAAGLAAQLSGRGNLN